MLFYSLEIVQNEYLVEVEGGGRRRRKVVEGRGRWCEMEGGGGRKRNIKKEFQGRK